MNLNNNLVGLISLCILIIVILLFIRNLPLIISILLVACIIWLIYTNYYN